MIKQRINLLVAIREGGFRQYEFAKMVNESEPVVSQVINGHRNLDEARKIKYAKVLGKKVSDLFPED